MTTHELKLDTKYFEDVKSGKKNFEIRKNDRDFKNGDILKLKAYGKTGIYANEYSYKYFGKSSNGGYVGWWNSYEYNCDTITAKIVYILSSEYWNEPNNLKEFIFDTPEDFNSIVDVVIELFGADDELPEDYVVLGIEVINS